jgi:hypothetical protein
MPRGPRNLRIACDGKGLTRFGGVALLQAFFQRLGVRGQLQRWVRFPQRNNTYSISETVEALLYPLILGLGRVETTEPLRHNGVFQYLAGLPCYPEASTLRRFLRRLARLGRMKLVALHDAWRHEMLARPQRQRAVVLDLDGTVLTVYGRQEGAKIGFNPKKRGRPSYLPLLCFEGQTADVWAGSYHPGNTPVSLVVRPLLRGALSRLPDEVKQIRVRADAAFFDHKFFRFLEEKKVFYVIAARITKGFRLRLAGLNYRPVSPGVWAAEFRHQPQRSQRTHRFFVIRRPVPEEPSAQLHLFQMGGYTYQLFVTNLNLTALNLWRFYNQRATAELIIRQLKEAYALGKIPTHDFAANEMYFQIALLAYNLLNWFKRLCVPPRWQRATLQRLRQQLLVVPAQLVRPGGVPTLRIAPSCVHTDDFQDILRRIQMIKPFSNSRQRGQTARREASRQPST